MMRRNNYSKSSQQRNYRRELWRLFDFNNTNQHHRSEAPGRGGGGWMDARIAHPIIIHPIQPGQGPNARMMLHVVHHFIFSCAFLSTRTPLDELV